MSVKMRQLGRKKDETAGGLKASKRAIGSVTFFP